MKPIDETMSAILVGLTLHQKYAILTLVLGIASCDAVANEAELDLLQTYLTMLGVSRIRQALIQLDEAAISDIMQELSRLSPIQKELFALMINHMIRVDGPANDHEIALATYFFDEIGLPTEPYIALLREES